MERIEVNKLIDKIQAFRQSFIKTNSLLEEWAKVLEPYRYEDVDKKLMNILKKVLILGNTLMHII